MKLLGATLIAATLILTSCYWRDASGKQWYTAPAVEQGTTYAKGAYDACMIHNLRVFKARGADIQNPDLHEYLNTLCLRTATETLTLLGPARGIQDIEIKAKAEPTPTPCGGCL